MPLCGSSFCGCALVSVPATAGEINGAVPTIDVAGNGTGASPWNLTLNDEWAGEVAEFITGVRYGTLTATTSAGGDVTVSFGATFAAAPVVVAVVERNSTAQTSCHFPSVATTTQQVVRVTSNDAVLGSTSVKVHWIAIGILA